MSDDSPHPFPTWEEFASAQAGRWFFLKWMLAGGITAAASLILINLPNGLFNAAEWEGIEVLMTWWAVWGLSQGWALFRCRWRAWVWMATWSIAYFAVWGTVLPQPFLILMGILQMLLLLGVRQCPAWWLLAAPAGFLVSSMIATHGWYAVRFLLARVVHDTGLRAWPSPYIPAVCTGVIFYFLLTGAALAWLMPPVFSPAGTAEISPGRQPGD